MNHMIIFYNHEDLHNLLGPQTVYFAETENQLQSIFISRDQALSREDFLGEIPTSRLVEHYTKRAVLTEPGTNGNDYVFVNAWQAPWSREQAFKMKYGTQ